ncbi:MAG: D-aminoacylase [Lysobacterales bacterium]|jgi:N-acyl-D-amino-acid deacylase
MRAIHRISLALLCAVALAACGPQSSTDHHAAPAPDSTLISDVIIVDGSGAPGYPGAVRLRGDEIVEVGDLDTLPDEMVISGGGLVLAPGFIDTHSHADEELFDQPEALADVSQGITTVVIGQDGASPYPLGDFREKLGEHPAALNVAAYSGHNTLRELAMGDDYKRNATETEVSEMSQMLERDMDAGALGLAAGLEYDPGIYSSTAEVVALARVAAARGGRYISHVRSEDRWLEKAIDEIIQIGRTANIPVQVSHIKLAMTPLWGRAGEFIAKLDAARADGVDITADIYPYTYWQSNMMVLLPKRDITDRAEVEFMLKEIAPPDGMWFTLYKPHPEYVGMTLSQIAEQRGEDPATTFMTLIAASEAMKSETGEPADQIIGTSMREDDIAALLAWPHTNVCTDGSLDDLHPRGWGAFPRVLARYVREQKLLSLEEAVHKMSGLAAEHMGFTDRGEIRPGAKADLVLFDPETVTDNATPQNPKVISSGIQTVWVNGVAVFDNGEVTGALPGRFVARAGSE